MFWVFVGQRARRQSGMRCRDFLFDTREPVINLGKLGREFGVQFIDPAREIGDCAGRGLS